MRKYDSYNWNVEFSTHDLINHHTAQKWLYCRCISKWKHLTTPKNLTKIMNILKLIAPDRAYHQWTSLLSLTRWILFYHGLGVYQVWQVKDASKASYTLHTLRKFCECMYAFFAHKHNKLQNRDCMTRLSSSTMAILGNNKPHALYCGIAVVTLLAL